MNTVSPVTIRLSPAGDGKVRIEAWTGEETIYTRLTKMNAGFVGRVERYLREANIYRQTAYKNDGLDMLATGAVAR